MNMVNAMNKFNVNYAPLLPRLIAGFPQSNLKLDTKLIAL
jgi:hypothetical protein